MKRKVLGACLGAFMLFGGSLLFSIESSVAKGGSSDQGIIPVNIECKGTAGHCFEYSGTTYYGKAYVTDK